MTDIVELGFNVDTRGLVTGTAELGKMGEASEKTSASMEKVGTSSSTLAEEVAKIGVSSGSLAEAVEKVSTNSGSLADNVGKISTSGGSLGDAIGPISKSAGDLSLSVDKIKTSNESLATSVEKVSTSTGGISDDVEKLGTNTGSFVNNVDTIKTSSDGLTTSSDAFANAVKRIGEESDNIAGDAENLTTQLGLSDEALSAMEDTTGEVKTAMGDLSESTEEVVKSMDDMGEATETVSDKLIKWGKLLGALALGYIANEAIKIYRAFETMERSLVPLVGSTEAANVAFKMLQKFAQDTPASLAGATEAFKTLTMEGMNPTKESLEAYGNLASGFQTDIATIADAAASLAGGMNSAMERFGIDAKASGDYITLTYQGVGTTIKNESEAIQGYLIDMGNTKFAGAMADEMDTIDEAILSLGEKWESLAAQFIGDTGIGDAFKGVVVFLGTMLTTLTGYIEDVNIKWAEFKDTARWESGDPSPTLRKIAEAFQELGKWLGPAVPYMDEAALALVAIGATAGAITLLGIGLGLLVSPIGLVVGAVTLLAGSTVLLVSNWEKVSTWWDGLWAQMKASIDKQLPGFADMFDTVYAVIIDLGEKAWISIKDSYAKGWDAVKSLGSLAFAAIGVSITLGWNLVKGLITGGFQILTGDFSKGWATITATVTQLGKGLQDGFKELWPKLKVAGIELIAWLNAGFFGAIGLFGQSVIGLGKKLIDGIKGLWTKMENAGGELIDALKRGWDNKVDSVKDFFGKAGDLLFGGSDEVVKEAEKKGEEVSMGYGIGLESGAADAYGAGFEMGSEVITGIADATQSASPSVLAIEQGNNVVDGFRSALEIGTDSVREAAENMSAAALTGLDRLLQGLERQRIELEKGPEAARRYELGFTEGLTPAVIEHIIAEERAIGVGKQLSAVRDKMMEAIEAQAEEQRIQNIYIEEGADAAGIAAVEFYDYSEALATTYYETEKTMEIQRKIHDVMSDLTDEQEFLTIALNEGADAAAAARLVDEGWEPAVAELTVAQKNLNIELQKRIDQGEAIKDAIEAQTTAQYLQNIEVTEGADAARLAALGLEGYSDAMAENKLETEKNMVFQKEFYTALKTSLVDNIGDMRNVLSDMGGFMKAWLVNLITEFAANKVMVYMGFGDSGSLSGPAGILSSIGSMISGAPRSSGDVGTSFDSGEGPAGGMGSLLSSVSGGASDLTGRLVDLGKGLSGTGESTFSLSGFVGNLGTSIGSTFGSFGGMIGASNAATTGVATLADATNVAAGGMNSAATSMGSTIVNSLGAAAAAYFVGEALGDLVGAANSTAVGIGSAVGMIVGGPLGALIGGTVGTLFGSSWAKVMEGFDAAYSDGSVTGKSFEVFEKERIMWGGRIQDWVFGDLAPEVENVLTKFFGNLNNNIIDQAKVLGIAGAESIMDGFKVAEARFEGEDAAEMFDAWLTEAARSAYTMLAGRLGPELQLAISDSLDMTTAPIEEIEALFAEVAIVSGALVPVLDAMGISLGKTADEAEANGLRLAESMGGAGVAVETFTQFAIDFAPAGTLAGLALKSATDDLKEWNAGIGFGNTAITGAITTFDEFIGWMDRTGASTGQVGSILEGLDLQWDATTGALSLNRDMLITQLGMIDRTTEAGKQMWGALKNLLNAYDTAVIKIAESNTSVLDYGEQIERTGQATEVAGQQFDFFVTQADDVNGALTLNTGRLDLYMLSLDRSTEAGERAWQSANNLALSFDYVAGSSIDTSDELYALATAQDWTTEAGRELALSYIEQGDALKVVEADNARLLATLDLVSDAAELLNLNFDKTSPLAIDMAESLVELMGGIDSFNQKTGEYYQSYFTLEERQAASLADASTSLGLFNNELVASGMATVNTKAELRELISGLDLTTEAGQRLYVAAIETSGAMNELETEYLAQTAVAKSVSDSLLLLGIQLDKTNPRFLTSTNNLVELMGGLDNFNTSTSSYYQNYYDEAERAQLSLIQSASAVQAFNDDVVAAGGSAITSTAQFREYVESIDVTTAAGALAFAQAMLVEGAFKAVAETGESVAEIYEKLPDDLKATFDIMLADAGLTADMLAEQAGNIYSTIDGIGQNLSLMDIMFIELNGTLVESAAGVDGATYQIGESLYTITTNAEGMKTLVVSSVNDMVTEVDSAMGGMAEQTTISVMSLYGDWVGTLGELSEVTEFEGSALIRSFQLSLETIVEHSGVSGTELVGVIDAAFTQVLLDAGIVRENLPPELQRGYDEMLINAVSLADGMIGTTDAMVLDTAANAVAMYDDWKDSMTNLLTETGIGGDHLIDSFVLTLGTIVEHSDTSGGEMVRVIDAAFTQVLLDAGIVRAELPAELQAGFDDMVRDAAATATALSTASSTMQGEMDAVSGSITHLGNMARDANSPTRTVADAIRALAGSAEDAAARISAAAGRANANSAIILARTIALDDEREAASLATGLDNVPYDNFPANLHKEEMVTNASVSAQLRAMGVTATSIPENFGAANEVTFSAPITNNQPQQNTALLGEMKAMRKEIEKLTRITDEYGQSNDSVLEFIASTGQEQTGVLKKSVKDSDRTMRQIAAALP